MPHASLAALCLLLATLFLGCASNPQAGKGVPQEKLDADYAECESMQLVPGPWPPLAKAALRHLCGLIVERLEVEKKMQYANLILENVQRLKQAIDNLLKAVENPILMDRIFGTKVSVISWIWVAAWSTEMNTPTTRDTPSMNVFSVI